MCLAVDLDLAEDKQRGYAVCTEALLLDPETVCSSARKEDQMKYCISPPKSLIAGRTTKRNGSLVDPY